MKDLKNPIIIGGCGSSGTTLLRKMLNAHENISCGEEMDCFSRPLLYTTSISKLYTMYDANNFDALDDDVIFLIRTNQGGTWFGLNRGDAMTDYFPGWPQDEIDKAIGEIFDNSESPVQFFRLFFSRYASSMRAKRWAEKSPNNIFCVNQIFKSMPDARFINVVRDGRDVVHSLTERRKFHPYVAMIRWLFSVNAAKPFEGHSHFLRVKYEDMVRFPEANLKYICGFLNEDFDPAMLDYWKSEKPPGENESPTAAYGTQPVNTDSIGKWKSANPTMRRAMRLVLNSELTKLGYRVN